MLQYPQTDREKEKSGSATRAYSRRVFYQKRSEEIKQFYNW